MAHSGARVEIIGHDIRDRQPNLTYGSNPVLRDHARPLGGSDSRAEGAKTAGASGTVRAISETGNGPIEERCGWYAKGS